MKKYSLSIFLHIMLLSGIVMLFSSCEDMIEENLYDSITEIEDSDTGANQYITGVYSFLLDDMFRWDQFPKVLDMDCDYATGPDWSLSAIGAGNFQNEMDPVWTKSYTLIHRANNAIEKIEEMSNVTPAYQVNTIGEMKFLKAWGYFLLVRAYGAVPIHYKSVNAGSEFHQPRQPIPTVYEHIISLLTEAEDAMYKNTDVNFTEGHASAGAAASLLAKVYLTMGSASLSSGTLTIKGGVPFTGSGDNKVYTNPTALTLDKKQVAGYESLDSRTYFELARDKAKQVMDGEYGSYDLLSFGQLWTAASRNKTEHIFSIQPVTADTQYGLGISRYYTGTENTSGIIIEGLFHGCRDHWYKLFESRDLRIEQGVMHRWRLIDQLPWDGGFFYPNNDEWSIKARGYYVAGSDTIYDNPATGKPFEKDPLYSDGYNYVYETGSSRSLAFLTKYYNASDRTSARTDVPWPVLRFADVLLIYAEAANEVNGSPTSDALAALNRVRVRSNATSKSLSGSGSIGSLESFRSFVVEERARELALEGDRRWDLIRWGVYLDVMNAIGGYDEVGIRKVREDKHLLYPIPTDEILTNKAINENNPGW
ncbi:MAG: RagB/SusD family nutrient uptake outer membrane protein [Prevotella sp.]|jgi:hypothetical protein|nr:RagB/SusD family nutrient uptake outer membrane protein [Prevotella sp.]